MKKFLQIISLSVAVILLNSCASYQLRQGNHAFRQMAYSEAVTQYEKSLKMKPTAEAKIQIAESYRLMNNTVKAEEAYSKVMDLPEAKPIHKLHYAQMLMRNGKKDTAKTWLSIYLRDNPNDKAAQDLLASCDMENDLKKDSLRWVVNTMIINTGQSNFSPVRYKDGLVFTSDRAIAVANSKKRLYSWTGKPFLDLYFTRPDAQPGSWTTPEPIRGDVNGNYHDGPAAFGNDSLMFFTRNSYLKKKVDKTSESVVNLKIYQSNLSANAWNNVKEFPLSSKEYSIGHPTLSHNGNTMYFTSDMPGGLGGTDIWMSKRVNGVWSNPVNMGPKINTSMNEMFPTLYNDSMLYFSSEGHTNMGGLDLFFVRKDGNDWSEAKNLGYPINSTQDDFGIALNDTTGGWFSSNRENPMQDKIYSFTDNNLYFMLEGITVNKITQMPLEGVLVEMINRTTGHKDTMTTAADGRFYQKLDPNTEYRVIGSKFRFFTNTEKVSTIGLIQSQVMYVKLKLVLEMEEIIVNKPVVMENIYYDFDMSEIRPDAQPSLDKLTTIMKDNPDILVELSSHTDSRGSDDYNQKLSDRRAQAAVDYLVLQGVDKDRLVPKGYGETRLVNPCKNGVLCEEKNHQKNRRTEFKITGFKKKENM